MKSPGDHLKPSLGEVLAEWMIFFKNTDCLSDLGIVSKNRRTPRCRNNIQVCLLAVVVYFRYQSLFLLYEALVMSFRVFKKNIIHGAS